MADVAGFVLDEALPFLERQGTFDGRLAYLSDRVTDLDEPLGHGGRQDVNINEELVTCTYSAATWPKRPPRLSGRTGGPRRH
jgi:hypothetical protein